jgi:hypothetical protein
VAGQTAALIVSATTLTDVTLSGSGTALVGITLDEVFEPLAPTGSLRLLGAKLPATAADSAHAIDLIAAGPNRPRRLVDPWFDPSAPGSSGTYFTFAPGSTLAEGRIARVYGGLTTPPADLGVDLYAGGGAGTAPPPPAPCSSSSTRVGGSHTSCAGWLPAPSTAVTGVVVAAHGDGTRAFLLPTQGSLNEGHYRLALTYHRDAGPELPVRSLAGWADPEPVVLQFTAG